MSRRSRGARADLILAAAVSLLGLSGCASLGGNIKGSFSCKAPDGVCAPSSSIDDRALAMISGDGGGVSPAGPYLEEPAKGDRSMRTAVSSPRRTPIQGGDAGRTREKVLRIVFQPYIDERGRLHEASAVHAVVAQGEWQEKAIAGAAAIPPVNVQAALSPQSESLAEVVEKAGNESLAAIDPGLPDPAVVAAARARAADPVAAIKSDVAARLAPKPSTASGRRREPRPTGPQKGDPNAAAVVPAQSAKVASPPVAGVGMAPATGAPTAKVSAPPSKTTAASQATARVKSDERYVAASREAQEGARKAAGQASLPDLKPALKPTVTTVDFPGAVPEDN